MTVSYSVKVQHANKAGDSQLANFLLDPDQKPPADPVCGGGDDCTFNPVSSIDVVKTVDPKSQTTVVEGQKVNYTISFTNTGHGKGVVDYTDHLAGVIDDAGVIGAPESSDPALIVTGGDDRIRVRGALAGGKTVKVTYQVKVKSYAEQGDHQLGNFVTVTGQEPPTTCGSGSSLCTENPTKKPAPPVQQNPKDQGPGGTLAQTGSPFVVLPAALIGLLMIGMGSWILVRRSHGSKSWRS